MNPLQDLLNRAPDGTTASPTVVDLGNKTYYVGGDPTVEYPVAIGDKRHDIIVKGSGAEIHVGPSKLRHRPAILNRGTRITFAPGVAVIGDRESGMGWDETREAQHGIECQGATTFACQWQVENVFGNSLSAGLRIVQGQPERWSTYLDIDMVSRQAGRQHFNWDAAEHIKLRCQGDTCVRSAVDIEPPGSRGGCRDLYFYDSDLRGHFFFALANKGAGSNSGCQDIVLDGVRCHGQAFGVRVVPVTDKRRQRYTLKNCTSDVVSHISPLTFWNVDGVVIRNITQPIDKNVVLARFNDCTGIDCPDYPYVSG